MIQITCPNCGLRNVQEFRFGGEYNPRPKAPLVTADTDWTDYLYMRDNKVGTQKEWWYHRAGCGAWFLAERHTKTNEMVKTYHWQATE
ncbi:MAG: sarcosine oxidase subunit delta [Chloroflexi bacterium]|nr:sarcosine oxidase subunit delta [Chloroflexota bacterium]